jgi:hypothetical protein
MVRTRTTSPPVTRRPRRVASIVRMGPKGVAQMISKLAENVGEYVLDDLERRGTQAVSANTRSATAARAILVDVGKANKKKKKAGVAKATTRKTADPHRSVGTKRQEHHDTVAEVEHPLSVEQPTHGENVPNEHCAEAEIVQAVAKRGPRKIVRFLSRTQSQVLGDQRSEVLRQAVHYAKRPSPQELALQEKRRLWSQRENQAKRQADAALLRQAQLNSKDPVVCAAAMQEEALRRHNPPLDEFRSPMRYFAKGPEGVLVEISNVPNLRTTQGQTPPITSFEDVPMFLASSNDNFDAETELSESTPTPLPSIQEKPDIPFRHYLRGISTLPGQASTRKDGIPAYETLWIRLVRPEEPKLVVNNINDFPWPILGSITRYGSHASSVRMQQDMVEFFCYMPSRGQERAAVTDNVMCRVIERELARWNPNSIPRMPAELASLDPRAMATGFKFVRHVLEDMKAQWEMAN